MDTKIFKNTIISNLYAGLGVFGSLFFVVIIILPSFSSFPSLRNQIEEKSKALKDLKVKSSRLNALLTSQTSLKSSLKIVDTAIPSKDNVPTLMTEVQRIASDSGVILKALQFGSGSLSTSGGSSGRIASDKTLKRVMLQVIAEGSFANLQSFLKNIESASRIITVDNISFEAKKTGPGSSTTLSLTSYYVDQVVPDPTFSVDLGDTNLKTTLSKLKDLKVYESEVTFSGVGKANPFE